MLKPMLSKLTEITTQSRWVALGLGAITLYLIGALLLGIHWSQPPQQATVEEIQATYAPKDVPNAVGTATVGALLFVTDTLLTKPGGYLSNDITPPGLWLDNMPNWEFGVLVQSRDLARALRKDLSRSQSQSTEDVDLVIAEPALNYDSTKWFPSAESSYRKSIESASNYQRRLATPGERAQFYARADNLRNYLADVETRLGSLSQQVSDRCGSTLILPAIHRQSSPLKAHQSKGFRHPGSKSMMCFLKLGEPRGPCFIIYEPSSKIFNRCSTTKTHAYHCVR